MSRAVWLIILVCAAGLAVTAFLPSWQVRGEVDARPLAIPPFLVGHAIGATTALAAAAWLVGLRWARVVFWTQAVLTLLLSLFIGLLLHLLAWDCFEHKGRSPDIGVTTVPSVIAVLLWYPAMWIMMTKRQVEPRARSGRVAAAGAWAAFVWFGVFALGNATQIGNHIALVASLFLVIAAWNAADE
ncbi:MAG TPA: hypothetical protein VKE22_10485 [Haliangiales bacterium]|nr:hypothetical protein [Haliangiales bacterium]